MPNITVHNFNSKNMLLVYLVNRDDTKLFCKKYAF